MHAPSSHGPQIGYAVVVAGTVIKSSERRPALALPDIATQISQLNAGRYATGQALLDAPRSLHQLHPLYAGANPHLDALQAGQQPPAARVGCSSNAMPIGPIRSHAADARNRMASGYRQRLVRA